MSTYNIDSYGSVLLDDKIVAPGPYEAIVITSSHLTRGLWIQNGEKTDNINDLKFFTGYEGALLRVWMNKEKEVMLSSRKCVNAKEMSFNKSKTFGEMAIEILPENEILFANDKSLIHYFIFVNDHLFQASKSPYPGKTYGVYLYSMKEVEDGKWIAVKGLSPPTSKGFYPVEKDFNKKFNRVIFRKELTLNDANLLLTTANGNHRYFEIGEFIYAETQDNRHIRINSESYRWRRDVVGDGGNIRIQFEKVFEQLVEVNGVYNLPITIVNFGVPKLSDNKIITEKKEWKDMSERERKLAAMFIFANCLPFSGYKYMKTELMKLLKEQ